MEAPDHVHHAGQPARSLRQHPDVHQSAGNFLQGMNDQCTTRPDVVNKF